MAKVAHCRLGGKHAAIVRFLEQRKPAEIGMGVEQWRLHCQRPRARLADLGSGVDPSRPDNDVSAFEAAGITAAGRAATDELESDRSAT